MSNFDDHHTNWNDDLFSHRNDGGPFGGLTYGEVVSNQALAQLYGLETDHNDISTADRNTGVSDGANNKIVWYLILAETIGVVGILFFTFMF